MPQVMAIDYGTKRTGIAVTDDLQMIASGLKTVPTEGLMDFLKNYCAQEEVVCFVLGEPKTLKNQASTIEAEIQRFVEKLKKAFPQTPIERVDERFTSKMAFQAMIDGGLSKKRRKDKALIDEVSATLILQSYLYRKNKEK